MGGFGGGQPAGEVGLHAADPLLVGGAVQAESSWRAYGLDQAIAALPCAQHVLADSEPSRELADAQNRGIAVTGHVPDSTDTGQQFDSPSG